MMSRRFATVVTLVVVLAFVVVAVAPAFAATPSGLVAHARLSSATPADGSTVETAERVVLAFNEEVDPRFVKVAVEGPAGSEVGGAPQVEGRAVTQPLADDLPAGDHVVTYRVVSADGHPISGTVTFTTTATPAVSPSPTSASPTPSTAAPTSTAAAPAATPSATPSLTLDAEPASGDPVVPLWVWVFVGLLALFAALALAAQRRRPAPTATPDDASARRRDEDHDPFA